MAKKPSKRFEHREIVYDDERWTLLEGLRNRTIPMMETLEKAQLQTIVHGSIARGDVNPKSDIDVFIQTPTSSFAVETALQRANVPINGRLIAQATPTSAIKAHIETGENASVTFPLTKMRKVEREFYKFGGEATLETLKRRQRVSGIDKRLMLIEPTQAGHLESSIVGREHQAARMLGISAETVLDRVHALLRRDEVGRTGIFLKKGLAENETFEMALARLVDLNPAVRRRLTSLS